MVCGPIIVIPVIVIAVVVVTSVVITIIDCGREPYKLSTIGGVTKRPAPTSKLTLKPSPPSVSQTRNPTKRTTSKTTTQEETTTTENPCRRIEPPFDARLTDKLCNDGKGALIHIGTTCPWTPTIFVCFNRQTYRTYWTKHYLNHTRAGRPVTQSWSKKFFNAVDPQTFYNNYRYPTNKGHLTPRADFDSDVGRRMTFYYLNAAPQHRDLNQKNWASVERYVRKLANENVCSVKVITGTGGSLFTINHQLDYVYPAYFFKVLVFISGVKQVYVGFNDETVAAGMISSLCNIILDNPVSNWTQPEKGVVYTCRYDEELKQSLGLTSADVDYFEYYYPSGFQSLCFPF